MQVLHGRPGHGQFWQVGEIVFVRQFHRLPDDARALGQRLDRGAACNFGKILLDPPARLHRIEIARQYECHIVRHVPPAEKLLDVVDVRILQVFQRSDDLPVVRMVCRVQGLVDDVQCVAVRRVVDALAFLVLDDLFFFRQHRLGDGVDEPAELVRFGPDHLFKRILGNRLQIIGAVLRGRAVGARAADARAHLVEPALAQVLRFQEQQVFEQVREAGAPGLFTGRAHVRRQVHGHDRVGPVDVKNHVQPVRQRELLEVHF